MASAGRGGAAKKAVPRKPLPPKPQAKQVATALVTKRVPSSTGQRGGQHRKPRSSAAGAAGRGQSKRQGGRRPAASKSRGGGRFPGVPKDASKIVLAEFVVCIVLLILSPLTAKGSKDLEEGGAVDMTLKASALAFVFFVLALVSSGGKTASKIAAGFGGIVTLGYVLSQGDIFGALARLWGRSGSTEQAGGGDESKAPVG